MNCIPNIEECLDFARKIGASEILEVPILPREGCLPFRCHQNCEESPVRGFYIVKDEHGFLHAYSHSVYKEKDGSLVDITPFPDQTQYNVFMYGVDLDKYNCEVITYDGNSVFVNTIDVHNDLYFVYALKDIDKNRYIYVGMNKGSETISALYGNGVAVEFYAQNIESKELALTIKNHFKEKYGL
jgi:hypothetical protein